MLSCCGRLVDKIIWTPVSPYILENIFRDMIVDTSSSSLFLSSIVAEEATIEIAQVPSSDSDAVAASDQGDAPIEMEIG